MCNTKRNANSLFGVIALSLSLLTIPTSMFRNDGKMKPEQKSVRKADYVLTVEDSLASEKSEYHYSNIVLS